MTRRRATYRPGEGLLFVDKDRLLFVKTVDRGAASVLVTAAWSDRPLRLLAAAVVIADFEVPPFVFAQEDEKLQGMVFGAIEIEVVDSERSLIRGEAADTWNQFRGSTSSVVLLGDDVPEVLWIELGIVSADSFRWVRAEDSAPSVATTMPPSRGTQQVQADTGDDPMQPTRVEDPAETPADQPLRPAPSEDPDQSDVGSSGPDTGSSEPPMPAPESNDETMHDIAQSEASCEVERGPTIAAPRLGATANPSAAEHRSRASSLARRIAGSRVTPTSVHTSRPQIPEATKGRGGSDDGDTDSTLDLEQGDIRLDEPAPHRTVEARVCRDCDHPSPPTAVRCGACNASIVENGGEIRVIPQPSLGEIHLSGDRIESLDMDLFIGRNPARELLEPHQRAVVHGTGDRSVSRRHIELRLDGWQVVVTSLKADDHTVIESRRGHQTLLPSGVSRTLEVGDTVRYGGSWFCYEEGS